MDNLVKRKAVQTIDKTKNKKYNARIERSGTKNKGG